MTGCRQEGNNSVITRLLVRLALFLSLLISTSSIPRHVHGQAALDTDEILASAKSQLSLSEQQTAQLRPLIEKRINSLRTLALKYSAGGKRDDTSMWNELRSSRISFQEDAQRLLTAEQRERVPAVHAEIERRTVDRLREAQVELVAHQLKLKQDQSSEVRTILTEDFDKKVGLLQTVTEDKHDDDSHFTRDLKSINDNTVRNLQPILTAEQLAKFRKVRQTSGGSRSLLWGAVPSSNDLASSSSIEAGNASATDNKKGEWVIAPIPVINPTLENGLALGIGYLYRLDNGDKASPPSVTGIGGFRTSNGSRGYALLQKFVLKENKYRLLLVAGSINLNYKFFGIGAAAGDAGVSIPVRQSGNGFLIDGSIRTVGRWFVGLRYFRIRTKIGVDRSNVIPNGESPMPGTPQIPEIELNLRTAGLGPTLEFDSRSDSFYPRKGSQYRFSMSFHSESLGGRRRYETYQTFFNKYMSAGPRQVLAVHAAGCYATGSVPFYDLCIYGQSKDVRGYEVGRYLDRVMVATQAEYRVELPKRFGVAAFLGIGEVAHRFLDLRSDALKPGGGIGLRFRLTKESHINLRVDYGWGIDSKGLYLGVSEAF